jgi:glucose dehydrogenase
MVCVAVAAIVAASAAGRDWIAPPTKDFPLTGGDYWHRRYSALDQINTSNVKKLGGAWMIRLEEGRPGGQLQGTPVVTGGVMYVTTGTRNALARTTND